MKSDRPFFEKVLAATLENPGSVIFPEGDDDRVVEAARLLLEWKAVKKITLLTSGSGAHTTSSRNKWISDARLHFLSTSDSGLIELTRKTYQLFMAKKAKSVEISDLERISTNALFQAGSMLLDNRADCVVAGCVATTGEVIRAALGTVGLTPGIKMVSGSFILNRSEGGKSETYVFADCGVVIEPTAEQLVDIAVGSCDTLAKITGEVPVVAFLSFSTKGSASHPRATKMREAAEMFKVRMPHIDSDGELQFDAAVVAAIGQRKAPNSRVSGRANCFIFPDLDSGNIAYKITERLAGFRAYGPILQGLARPFSDLSRGAAAEDIAVSALINMLRSRTN
jgi:phosphate acetyltransferase